MKILFLTLGHAIMYKMKGVHYMRLYELIYSVVKEVEREKGNIPKEDVVEEKVEYILKNSTMKYNANTFRLESYTSFGVKHWKDVELELQTYLLFRVNYDFNEWVLKTFSDLRQLEFDLRNSENTIQVVLMNGNIKQYFKTDYPFNGAIRWKDAIYQVEYAEEDGEDKNVLIYDIRQLEEVIVELVKEGMEKIRAFNIVSSSYENFYLKSVIYSTSQNLLPVEIFWGKSEISFIDLAEDNEEYYEEYIW